MSAPLEIGDTVRLRNNVVGFGVGDNNASANIVGFIEGVEGGLRLDRELRGCRCWNVLDVQRMNPSGRRRRSVHERAVEAEAEGSRLLADANEAKEKGQRAKADRLYAAGQRWLDKFNALTGRGE